MTCKKPPRKKKQGQGTRGSLYLFGVGRVQQRGCPGLRARGGRREAAGPGQAVRGAAHLALPLRARSPPLRV